MVSLGRTYDARDQLTSPQRAQQLDLQVYRGKSGQRDLFLLRLVTSHRYGLMG